MPQEGIWGWDATNQVWVKILVNAAGKLIIDPSEILEDTPTDGEVGKAPTSNWAHDHGADPDAHHEAFTSADHTAIGDLAPHHAEAHTLASHTTKAHSELTGVGTSDHHVRYTDAEALAAAIAGGLDGGPTIVLKTANEIVNNSSVLQNDDHLLKAIAANEIWLVEVYPLITTGATPDFKYLFTLPTGATGYYLGQLATINVWAIGEYTTGNAGFMAGALSGRLHAKIAVLVINGVNAGNIQFQWAQNTADASNTIVAINSFLIANKIG